MSRRLSRFGWVLAAFLAAALVLPAQAADTVVYYHTDALRSVTVVTNAQGQVIERTQYAPYGAVLNRPLRDGPGYGGHEEDAATGLVYMQQRYYDPESGRFLSVDPVAVNPNTGTNFNRYAYAKDNPYRYTDPFGMCAGSHISNSDGTCASTGSYTTMPSVLSATPVRAFNSGHKAYIQYADGSVVARSGSRPWRDNNPGDLRHGSSKAASTNLALGWDFSPTGPHDKETAKAPFAIFGTLATGDSALRQTLLSVYGKDTVSQAINSYAPSLDFNNPKHYSDFVKSHTGASPSAAINSLTPTQLNGAIDAIKAMEGFYRGGTSVVIYDGGLGPFSQ